MMVSLLRLSCSAGACVLAAGLLMGVGGAVAAADPDSSVSATQTDDPTNASAEQQSTGARVSRSSSQTTFTQRMARLFRAANRASSIPPGAGKPEDEPSGVNTRDEMKDDSDPGAAVRDPVAAAPNDVTPGPDAVAPLSDPLAAVPNEVAPPSVVGAPVVPPSVAEAPVPNVAGPGSNVVALVQDMVSSVVGAAVVLTQLPSDLYSFLLGVAGVQPVVGGAEAVGGRGLSVAAAASVASRLPLGLSPAGISGAPLAGVSGPPVTGETAGATLDVSALGRASAASRMAPPAPDAAVPIRAGSSFRRVVGEIVLSVSLWALAAAALPGAGGLGLITLAGVRVGYRQAKAGVAVRTTGIAHFAREGPLGIVRSGSLVVVHPRALRVVRPAALTADHLLDEVA
jgi:hypothetical protein